MNKKENHIICLNDSFSTTRLFSTKQPEIKTDPASKLQLQLPPNIKRRGEGGLRTKGYFKTSVEGKPLISVITVVYNADNFIEETISSIINQTYDNVEYILVDGGSTDKTLDIIDKYEDVIDYWVSEGDSGIFDAMNKAIDLASGEWLNFLNAGDKYVNKEILSQINKFLKDDHCLYCFGFEEHIIIENRRYKRIRMPQNILYNMPTCHNAMFFPENRSIKYNPAYKFCSDYSYFREHIARGYGLKINKLTAVAWLKGGYSDKYIFSSLKDRILINFEYDKNSLFPIYLLFYIREYFLEIIKRILPMDFLNKIRRMINFEFTEVSN